MMHHSKIKIAAVFALCVSVCASGCADSKKSQTEKQTTVVTSAASEAESSLQEDDGVFSIEKMPQYDPEAKETVIEVSGGNTDIWSYALPDYAGKDGLTPDYIDARTFQRDRDMHITVKFELADEVRDMFEAGLSDPVKTPLTIAPCHIYDGSYLGESEELFCNYPAAVLPNDGVYPGICCDEDGSIHFFDADADSFEFTIPAIAVNAMSDRCAEGKADGLTFKLGGKIRITSVTVNEGNIFLASEIAAAGYP